MESAGAFSVFAALTHPVYPRFHRVELVFEYFFVTVGSVYLPRADDRRVAPRARAAHVVEYIWYDMRHAAVASLVGGEIVKPLFEEALNIEIEARRADKHLRVARPAEPLVALRTIHRYIEEIVFLAVEYVLDKFV